MGTYVVKSVVVALVLLVGETRALQHAVIVQNKGGGHGEIGYHLAKALVNKGMEVTLLQDASAKMDAEPFKRYGELSKVRVETCDLASPPALSGVTHVFDNNSKEPSSSAPYVAMASAEPGFQLYSFVSSAGMYTGKGLLKETGAVKDPATGQRQVELDLAAKLAGKWCAFRPQYIYGPYTNKRDYIDWFLNRAARNIAMCVPGDAQQPVSLTHCEDVAALLASVVGNEAQAADEIFNCGTDKLVSYGELCCAAARAFGKTEGALVAELPPGTKSSFPFRPNAEGFAVSVRKAKTVLGWPGAQHSVLADLDPETGFYIQDFLDLGLDKGDLDTSKDLLEESSNLDYVLA